MKNSYFFLVLGLLLMGCSVDNDEMNFNEDQIQTTNLEINDVCLPSIYKIEDSGELLGNVTISNSEDGNMAYIKFSAETGFYITEISLIKANNAIELPLNKRGEILDKLEKLTYESLSEVDLEYEVSSSFVLAARVTFMNHKGKKFTNWIRDDQTGSNTLTYLNCNVCISGELICEADAGADQFREYTLPEIEAIVNSQGDVERLYKSFLDEGVSRNGTFSPTISQLLAAFGANPIRDFKTIYTVTNEVDGVECSDSVELIIRVTPPRQDPICEADAGTDQFREYTLPEIEAIVNSQGDVERLYKSFLDEGVSRNGTFSPTISQLLAAFGGNPIRDFKTIYTVTNEVDGVECSDSVELIIRVTPPRQDPICEADAGTDQLREYTLAEIDALVYSPTSLADVYITLLDDGISTDGTFSDRTIAQLLTTFAGNAQYSRDYTTTYTVTNTLNGVECSDSAKLTIRVLDDRYSN